MAFSREARYGDENHGTTVVGTAPFPLSSDIGTGKAANAATAAAATARNLLSPSLLPLQDTSDSPIINLENWEMALEGIVKNQMTSWSNVMTRRKTIRGSRGGKGTKGGKKTAVVAAPPSMIHRRIFASSAGTLTQQDTTNDGTVWSCVGMLAVTAAIILGPATALTVLVFSLPFHAVLTCAAVWVAVEAVFMLIRYRHLRFVSNDIRPMPIPKVETVSDTLDRILELRDCVDLTKFLPGWFLNTPVAFLSYNDIREFVSFGFYYRAFDELDSSMQEVVVEHLERMRNHTVHVRLPEPDISYPAHRKLTIAQSAEDALESLPSLPTLPSHSLSSRQSTISGFNDSASDASSESDISIDSSPAADISDGIIADVDGTCAIADFSQSGQRMVEEEQEEHSAARLSSSSSYSSPSTPASPVSPVSPTTPASPSAESSASVGRSVSQGGLLDDVASARGEDCEERMPFMAHTKEPLRAFLHPLAFYVWGHIACWLTAIVFACLGFKKRTTDCGMHFWVREPRTAAPLPSSSPAPSSSPVSDDDDEEALVFVHGLGFGNTPYLGFIHLLNCTFSNKRMVVVELRHLAIQLSASVPTVEVLAESLHSALTSLHIARAAFVGHSYGSFVLAKFTRKYPNMVTALGLIDPPCLLLCLPNVAYNFIYKLPGGGSLGSNIAEAMRWCLVSRELQVARALCRDFNWQEYLLWADQLPAATVVMLAGADQIVPSPEIRNYLRKHGMEPIYNEGFAHAEFLARIDVQLNFVRQLSSKIHHVDREQPRHQPQPQLLSAS